MATVRHLPLPNKHVTPYIRPDKQKGRSMTIGLGFNCGHSVVLGSDRQMTRAGINKFYEQKLFNDVKDQRILAMVGANDLGLAKEIWEKLLEYPAEPRVSAVKAAFEEILNGLGRSYSELPVQLLLGISTPHETELISFIGTGIHTVSEFSVIGAGDA